MLQAQYVLFGPKGVAEPKDFYKSEFYKSIQSGYFNLEQFLITYLKSQDIQAALKAGGAALDKDAEGRAKAMNKDYEITYEAFQQLA
jgi:hypothetical protein